MLSVPPRRENVTPVTSVRHRSGVVDRTALGPCAMRAACVRCRSLTSRGRSTYVLDGHRLREAHAETRQNARREREGAPHRPADAACVYSIRAGC